MPKPARLLPRHRQHGNGHVGLAVAVRLEQVLKVHAIELIAGEDQHIVARIFMRRSGCCWRTASAVPWYQSAASRWSAGRPGPRQSPG